MSPAANDAHLAREAGSLALSRVRPGNPMAAVRAAGWANTLKRLGLDVPLFVTHDLGLLFTSRPDGQRVIGPHPAAVAGAGLAEEVERLLVQYQAFLQSLASSEPLERASSWRLRDELIAVLLAKVLAALHHRWQEPGSRRRSPDLPLDPQAYTDEAVAAALRSTTADEAISFLRFFVEHQLHVYTSIEQIDVDTLRLLGVFAPAEQGGLALPDLYAVFQSADANDVVNFSLELLPSVLETKRSSGVQTFAVDGYASIDRRGNVDSIVLSEFAYDDELFERKVIDEELYYYGHEKQREEERRLHYILIDASPSMRGVRQVFARGVAMTLAKKLTLQGDDVWLRFFDSRLYEVQRSGKSDLVTPYLLGFRSERGRNYTKVFRHFSAELKRLRREQHRPIVVYLVTHGQCHIPVELVEEMAREAYLYGVFILPSANVTVEYLNVLQRYQIVGHDVLATREGRRDRALEIINDASSATRPPVS
jgi:hypothetical protein